MSGPALLEPDLGTIFRDAEIISLPSFTMAVVLVFILGLCSYQVSLGSAVKPKHVVNIVIDDLVSPAICFRT